MCTRVYVCACARACVGTSVLFGFRTTCVNLSMYHCRSYHQEIVLADFFTWEPPTKFDLIYDCKISAFMFLFRIWMTSVAERDSLMLSLLAQFPFELIPSPIFCRFFEFCIAFFGFGELTFLAMALDRLEARNFALLLWST